ncbi:MAG: hypothetical protein ACFFH0_04540, partial [Promethearchaeota archaeon]
MVRTLVGEDELILVDASSKAGLNALATNVFADSLGPEVDEVSSTILSIVFELTSILYKSATVFTRTAVTALRIYSAT